MGSCWRHIMIVSALVSICFLHCSLATSCTTSDDSKNVITQHPSKVEAMYGVNVSFTCIIDGNYNVRKVSVFKDKVSVLTRVGSAVIHKGDNIFFEGTNYNFTLTVLVRNKTDSATYYCEALGDNSTICGAGTFIKIPDIDTGSTNYTAWVILGVVALVLSIAVCIYIWIKKKRDQETTSSQINQL